jgi:hypothetical protein
MSDVQRQPKFFRQPGYELFILVRSFSSKRVIEVHHTQYDPDLRAKFQQQPEKCHRIRATRHRYTHALARAQKPFLTNTQKNLLGKNERHRLMVSAAFGKLTPGKLFELPRLRKELLSPSPHAEVFRQIHPPNNAVRIDQEFSWP